MQYIMSSSLQNLSFRGNVCVGGRYTYIEEKKNPLVL